MAAIIGQDSPTLRAVNPRAWIDQTDYLEQQFRSSLKVFTTQRTDLLAVLEPLTPAGWTRTAIVTGAGKPIVRTVQNYAERLAVHERRHLQQLETIVNNRLSIS